MYPRGWSCIPFRSRYAARGQALSVCSAAGKFNLGGSRSPGAIGDVCPRYHEVLAANRSRYFTDSMDARELEANEETPRLTESFYRSLSEKEQFLLRRLRRQPG